MTGLYAFWPYSPWPTYLGGTITKMREDGFVETKEYGRGSWVKPTIIVPVKLGLEMRAKIDLLKHERRAKVAEIEKVTRAAMNAVVDRKDA